MPEAPQRKEKIMKKRDQRGKILALGQNGGVRDIGIMLRRTQKGDALEGVLVVKETDNVAPAPIMPA